MLICGDSKDVSKTIPDNSIDMVLTSPPYDNLRSYNGYVFDFEAIANELYRVLKPNCVMVWVVNDSTVKGSETGTSFKQALYMKEIGFALHDTMIYKKQNPMPQKTNRYIQCFEYMFVFSKGKPDIFNGIIVPCKYAGQSNFGNSNQYDKNGNKHKKKDTAIADTKLHENIFEYLVGSTAKGMFKGHPAQFPLQLAIDQISTWSNVNDTVLDPFCGVSTTGVACKQLQRNYIGIDISEEYIKLSKQRLGEVRGNN